MKVSALLSLASTVSAWSLPSSLSARDNSLQSITVKGNAFMQGNNRFFIRGVDYQPGGASNPKDPLTDTDGCQRDIKYFQQLGINTIRVYTIDNSQNHDTCMNALANAGIYLILDVNSGKTSLNRGSLENLKMSYNAAYLQSVFATIDAFKGYPNTLGFFSGNEVINAPNNTNTAPYIKAVTRDMKAYIKAQSKRFIPVGYSAADVESNRLETAEYLNCGSDDVRSDMFAFNDYSWCGSGSSFTISGWSDRVKEYSNYSLPLFLSEYGCNTITPRTFPEVKSLYDQDMDAVYSGGLVYEYTEEGSNYGLVKIDGDNVKTLQDFTNLQNQLKSNPSPTNAPAGNPSGTASNCPPHTSDWAPGMPDNQLPSMPSNAQQYIKNGAGKGLGLTSDGTQLSANSGMSTGTSTVGSSGSSGSSSSSSSSSGSSSSSSGNAAAGLKPTTFGFGPVASALVVVSASFAGAFLL